MKKDTKLKRLVLLDAHAILHRSYHGMPEWTDKNGNPVGALYGYISMISRIKNDLKPDYIAACYDLPKPTFRHLAYDNYKGHRSQTDEALKVQIEMSYDICKGLNIPVYTAEGFEADDILGTVADYIYDKYQDIETIIASGDMDTMQLINDRVKVYTLKKANDTALYDIQAVMDRYGLTPEQIPDYKAIAGDTSDNIIGVPGIGVKGATDLIQKYGDIQNLYKEIEREGFDFKAQGMRERMYHLLMDNKEGAEFSLTLATIRRDAPVDFTLTEWSIEEEVYRALCDRFNFVSLRNKFNDYIPNTAKKESEINIKKIENIETENEVDNTKDTLSKNKKIKKVDKSKDETKIDEYKYTGLKTMLNLIDSEQVNINIAKVLDYVGLDHIEDEANAIDQAKDKLEQSLKEIKIKHKSANDNNIDNMWDYYKVIEEPLLQIIDKIYDSGIKVDKSILESQSKSLHIHIKELEIDIYKLAGIEFNINSPKQLGDILYDKLGLGIKIKKTKTGQKSTGIDMLNSMRQEHDIIDKIISYRELFKLVSTYIDTLPTYVQADNRIHARLILNGAATGRFSCEHPNLQNLPAKRGRAMEIRKAFVAGDGKKLISLDYSQIELRLAAILSQDPNMIEIFEKGIDVHAGVAALVYDKDTADINSDERRHAKAINFGILYGMGVNALKESMGVERVVAQQFYDKYKQRFVILMDYLEKVKEEARVLGYTETLFGRRRHIPMIKSKLPFMRAQGERIAINAPIQGAGAEVIKLAMIDIDNYFVSHTYVDAIMAKPRLLLQVHDELVFEVDSHDDQSATIIEDIMKNVLAKRNINIVPLMVGVSTGNNLYELK